MTTNPDYPSLTPVDRLPLHPISDQLYACQQEDESGAMFFDWRCGQCVDKAEDVMRRGQHPVQTWQRDEQTEPVPVSLAWLVDRSRFHGIGSYLRAHSVG